MAWEEQALIRVGFLVQVAAEDCNSSPVKTACEFRVHVRADITCSTAEFLHQFEAGVEGDICRFGFWSSSELKIVLQLR